MRHFLLSVLLIVPMAAFAAEYSDSPLLVVGGQQPAAMANASQAATPVSQENPTQPNAAPYADPAQAITANFPAWAVTSVGQNSTGGNPVPAAPAAPGNAPVSAQPINPAASAAPTAPTAPTSPVNKLWPIDTVPIFMRSCMGFHVELAAPCKCIIVNLMTQMPHDEFLKLSAAGTIESDPRLSAIRYQCLGSPNRTQPQGGQP